MFYKTILTHASAIFLKDCQRFLLSRKRTFPLPITLTLAAAIWYGCNGARATVGDFKTVRVTRGDIEHRVIATGKIEPFSKVEIRSKVGGIVKTIPFEEGDRVQKGQVIVELDKDILASRVTEARAALERAQARYQQAQIEAEAGTLEVDSAQKKYDRTKSLFAQGLATKEQMEDAETALSIAKQNHLAKQAAVSIAKAELSAAGAARERAANELSYATIFSPLDGIVLSREVDVGSAVASVVSTMGTLIMTLGDVREMHMVGDVDESDIGLIKEGMPTRISVESYPLSSFYGKVKRISPLGAEKDRIMNFEVEVTIEETDLPLRTNMTADAEIIVEKRENVLLVAQNAIRYRHNQSYVEVPDNKEETGKRAVEITLGVTGTNFSEVLSGLKEGDEVIVFER